MTNKEAYDKFKKMLRIEAEKIAAEVVQINQRERIIQDLIVKQKRGVKSSRGNDRTAYIWIALESGNEQVGFTNLFFNEIDPKTVNLHTQFGKITFGLGDNSNKHCFVKFQNFKELNPTTDDKRRLKEGIVKFDFGKYQDSGISIFDENYSGEAVALKFVEWYKAEKETS